MEAINYASKGQNMILPDDAQIVQGVSGGAVYLTSGEGTVKMTGDNMAIFSLSIWRRWDGIVKADKPRPFFKFKNFKVFFDGNTDILNIAIQNDTVLQTAVKDDKNFNHWVFVFARNKFLTVYKNTKEVFIIPTDDAPVDLSEPFILGGDFTHATFDEFSIFDNELSKDHIDGLYQFISRGTNLSNVEGLINESVPQHTPHYLGTVKTAPDGARVNIFLGRKNGFNDANIGDWILIIEPIAGYKRGWCYRWQGASWEILDPPERYIQEYTACIKDQLELKDLFNDTKFFGAILCQYLGFNEAVGKSLTANKIFVDNFVTKKLLVDHDLNDPTDFELAINREVGMLAKNNEKVLFEISPSGGAYFNGSIYAGPLILDNTPEKIPDYNRMSVSAIELAYFLYKKQHIPMIIYIEGAKHSIVKVSAGFKPKPADKNVNKENIFDYIKDANSYYMQFTYENSYRSEWDCNIYRHIKYTLTNTILLKNNDNDNDIIYRGTIYADWWEYITSFSFSGERMPKTASNISWDAPPYTSDNESKKDMDIKNIKIIFSPDYKLFKLINLPISAEGLSTGSVYIDGDFLKIVKENKQK